MSRQLLKIPALARANACAIPMAGDGKVPFVCERILECATPHLRWSGVGPVHSREVPIPLTRGEIGTPLIGG